MAHCACPTWATVADDGNTGWAAEEFGVRCQENRCFSYVGDPSVLPD